MNEMHEKSDLEERCHQILEEKGGEIADTARMILLREKTLGGFHDPLRHISETWRDPLAPSMIILSCEAVGGEPDVTTHKAALAMTLMNLSINLWDDILDKTMHKIFIPTVLGKFGEGAALMIAGLSTAKAFSILSEMKVSESKHQTIMRMVWNYCKKLAKAKSIDMNLRKRSDAKPKEKLSVIKMQGISLETFCKIGAVLGNGSKDEIEHLGNYGRLLSTIVDLRKDFNATINLTVELSDKIRSGALPYTLLWAKDHSEKIKEYLTLFTNTMKPIDTKKIVEAVLETKALEKTISLLESLTRKTEEQISKLKISNTTKILEFFAKAQPKIFLERVSKLRQMF